MSEQERKAFILSGDLISISEAAKYTPYSAEYLSLRARTGHLKATKIGRNWLTTREAVLLYMEEQGVKGISVAQHIPALVPTSTSNNAVSPQIVESPSNTPSEIPSEILIREKAPKSKKLLNLGLGRVFVTAWVAVFLFVLASVAGSNPGQMSKQLAQIDFTPYVMEGVTPRALVSIADRLVKENIINPLQSTNNKLVNSATNSFIAVVGDLDKYLRNDYSDPTLSTSLVPTFAVSDSSEQGRVLAAQTKANLALTKLGPNEERVKAIVRDYLNLAMIQATFRGASGAQGIQGPKGDAGNGSMAPYSPIQNGAPPAIPSVFVPGGIVQPNPVQNFNGATLFAATDLSSQNFTTNVARINTSLTVIGTTTLTGQLSANGGITATDITSSGATTLSDLAGNGTRCVQTDNDGVLSVAAAACGLGGGGSQTPWTSAIDADGFALQDALNLEFRTAAGSAPAGTVIAFYTDNSGDLTTNVLTGKTFNVAVNGTDEYNFSSSTLNLNSNTITNAASLNGLVITANSGVITAGTWNADELTDSYVSNTLTSSIFIGSGSTTNAVDLGTAEVAGTLGVGSGGTGATSLTDLITLGTHTSGNYVATIGAGNGISGSSSTEGGAPTIALGVLTGNWNQTGAFDITLNNASSELSILESAGATFYGSLDVGDLAADATYTLSGTSGTILTSSNYSGTLGSIYLQAANNLSDLANAGTARTNLGLGSIATQNSNNVSITGGSITGITDLTVDDGGTGASTFTSNGVLYGNSTSAIQATAQGGANTVLVANSGAPSFSAAITVGTSVTSPTINATTALQTAGVTRIDSSGNLTNIGTITSGLINGQTISSSANFTGSVAVAGAITGATSYNGLVVTANNGTVTSGTWNGTALVDTYVSDTLTLGSGSSIHWDALNNYPAACSAGSAISALADTTNTCTSFNTDTSITLQDAYNATSGSSITTTSARDIDIVLANTATDSNLDIQIAADSTSTVSITRLDSSILSSPNQLLLLEDLDTVLNVANGLTIQTAGALTDAIDVSDAEIANAINIGANTILGTTGVIDFTNFDVGATGSTTIATSNTSGADLAITNSVAYTGTGLLNLTANSATTGTLATIGSTGVTTGTLLSLTSGGSAALTGHKGLAIALSGSVTGAQTTYGAHISNTRLGVSNTNVGMYIDASGGVNNYALLTAAGANVGIGTSSPTALFSVGTSSGFKVDASGTITGAVGITSAGATVNLNASSNFAVNIGTGSSTGLVTIGGGLGTFSLQTSNIDISSSGAITGATGYNGLVVTADTGVITTGTWNATALADAYVSDTLTASLFSGSGSTTTAVDLGTAEVAGTLAVGNGGTGATTFTSNGVLYGNTTSAVQVTAQGGVNTVLVANAGAPSFSAAITVGTSVTSPTINATTALQLNGTSINTAGTLSNVAYLNQSNAFTANQSITNVTIANAASLLSLTGTTTTSTVSGTAYGLYNSFTNANTSNADTAYANYTTVADATTLANTIYGDYTTIALSSNAAKTAVGQNITLSTSSTTADTIIGTDVATTTSGAISSGTRNVYGIRLQPASAAASTGGTTNVYGAYIKPSASINSTGTVNGYGVYIANGTYNTNATSSNIGLYVEALSGADSNYSAYFAGPIQFAGNTARGIVKDWGSAGDYFGMEQVTGGAAGYGVGAALRLFTSSVGSNAVIAFGKYTDASTFSTWMLINNAGNVGIGDTSPAALFTVGSGDLFQVNSSGAIAAVVGITSSGNYIQSAGTFSLTSANTTQTGTSSVMAVNANSLTSGTGIYFASSSLTSGKLVDLQVSGTAAASNTQTVLNIATAGANATSTQTTYGAQVSNTHSGTSSTNYAGYFNATTGTNNIAGYFTASGGTNNYAAIFAAGNVGIGTTSPADILSIGSGISSYLSINSSGDIYSGFSTLNGSSTANGAGTVSTSLTVTNGADFDAGNYVKITSANCGGTGVNPCYAKIISKATHVLTISPALTWANSSIVEEIHIPELGGTNTANTLANRFGRGYFIDGIVAGNGSTYFTDNSIKQTIAGSIFNFGDSNTSEVVFNAATTVTVNGSMNIGSNVQLGGGIGQIVGGDGLFLGGPGATGTPTFSFASDSTSGMYSVGSNIIGFTTHNILDLVVTDNHTYIPDGSFCVGSGGNCQTTAYSAGTIHADNTSVQNVDLAENYPSKDFSLVPGEVVMVDDGYVDHIKRSELNSSHKSIGVVSTKPGILLGSGGNAYTDSKLYPIALAGRVPVKVTTENGVIEPGDFLTVSATVPGAAMRASKAGPVVGQALEGFTGTLGSTSIGTISTFIKPTHYNGVAIENEIPGLVFNYTDLAQTELTSFDILASLMAKLPNLNSNNLSQINTDVVIANGEIVTPNVTTNALRANSFAAAASGGGINVESSTVFRGGLTVDTIGSLGGLLTFQSDIEFIGTPYLNQDTAGFAVIKTGASSVDITFANTYLVQPIVGTTISFEQSSDFSQVTDPAALEVLKQQAIADAQAFLGEGVSYVITNKTARGFTIVLNHNASKDLRFSWTAFAVKNANVFTSIDPSTITPPAPNFSSGDSSGSGDGSGIIPEGSSGDGSTNDGQVAGDSTPTE